MTQGIGVQNEMPKFPTCTEDMTTEGVHLFSYDNTRQSSYVKWLTLNDLSMTCDFAEGLKISPSTSGPLICVLISIRLGSLIVNPGLW